MLNTGSIDLQGDIGLGGNGTLTNNGALIKSAGAGTSSIVVQTTTNSGLIDIQSGTLDFVTSLPHTGGELRLTGGDVVMSAGTHTFDATSSITDPGLDNNLTMQTLGTTLTMNGAYTVGGTTTITSGVANFNVDANFPVLTTTGTVNLNLAGNTYTADTVNLNFGTLTVTDATSSLDIAAAFGWDRGSLGGAGTFNVLNTSLSIITGVDTKRLLAGTTLANDSLLQIASTDSPDLDGTLTNTGTVLFLTNAGFTGSGTFTNAIGATTRKSAGGGTSTISTATVTSNAGTFHVQSGTLEVDNLTDSSGTITVDAGTIFRTSGNLTSTGLIEGEGTVDVTTLFNQGNLNPGTSPGIITIDGDADFTGGTLNFEVDGLTPGTEHDQIQVTGTATLGGTIVVTAGFAPAEDDTFDLITCGTACNGSFDTETLPADFSLANLGGIVQLTFATCAGTICWDNTSGDGFWTTLTNWNTDVLPVAGDDVVIDLGGGTTVTLNSGTQTITSLTAVEDIAITGGGTTLTVSGTTTINDTLSVTGSSSVDFNGDASINTLSMPFNTPTVNLNLAGNTYTVSTLDLLAGTLNVTDATSELDIDTAFSWNLATLGGAGTTTLLAGTTGQAILTNTKTLAAGATFVNEGTFENQSSAASAPIIDGVFLNNNLIDLQTTAGFTGVGTLTNSATGTVQKSAGGGTSVISTTTVGNAGLIDVQDGTVLFTAGSTTHTGGEIRLSNASNVQFDGGTHSFDATSSITHPGAASNVTINASANFTTDGSYVVNGITTVQLFSVANFNTDVDFGTLSMPFSSPTVNLNLAGNTYTVSTLDLLAGTLNVTDATSGLDIDTAFSWNLATLGGAGTTTLLAGATGQAILTNTKTLAAGATFVNEGTFENQSSAASAPIIDGVFLNNNLIDLQTTAGFTGVGTLTNSATGTVQKSAGGGTSVISTTTVGNAGLIDVQDGVLQINNLGTSSGTISTANATTIRPSGIFTNTGTIQGEGTVDVVTLTNQGDINPGTSPGIITIDGDADFTGGTLNFEVDGLTPGTQHDQIVVTGNATLGGTIVVTYGFSPLDNDTFDLITCGGACSGAFTTETLPADSSLANLGAIVRLTFSSCAGTICWDDGGADGLWLTATNWTTDLLPGALDDVVIDFGGGNTVTLSSGVQSINTLINEDSLIINGSATLNLASISTSNGDLSLSTTLGGTGDLTVNGLFTWSSPGTTFVGLADGLTTAATGTVSLSVVVAT